MAEQAFDRSTVVATYSTLYEAELAQSHLAENEIDAFISRDDSGGMDPQMQLARGVRLIVHGEQAIEARQILEWMDAVPYKEFATDDDAEYETQRLKMWRQLGIALLIVGGATLLLAFGLWAEGARAAGSAAGIGAFAAVAGVVLRWAVDRRRPPRHTK